MSRQMLVTHDAASPVLHLVDGIVQCLFASNYYKTADHLHHPHDNWYQVSLGVCYSLWCGGIQIHL